MSDVSERVAALSPKERAALAMRLRRKAQRTDEEASETLIRRRAESGPAPLSFAQQRLWFIEQAEAGQSTYNLPVAYELTGTLDVDTLRRSLNEIVRRHDVLRTAFEMHGGEPSQVVAPTLEIELPFVDLTRYEGQQQWDELQRRADLAAQQPFDLERAPLLRATLLKLSDAEHYLVIVLHHIVADGWSLGVLMNELSTLYSAFSEGKSSPLAELPVQYADFAAWQRQLLGSEAVQRQLAYWKNKLDGAPSVLRLPTDRPRPAVQTHAGGHQYAELTGRLTEELKEFSQREGATLFMTLLAAFNVLLYRYTGQADINVGTPLAGRNRPEVEPLVGLFLNTLVLRTDLSGNPSFRELLGRVKEVLLEAHANQDVPFEKLVNELQTERNASLTPLFQVMFTLQNAPMEEFMPTTSGLVVSLGRLSVDIGATKFDLTLSVEEADERLLLYCGYKTDLFDASTITRMFEHFRLLLETVVARPDTRISDISVLTSDERRRLLVETNQTAAPFRDDACIHELFEEQAARTPETIALIYGRTRVSYGELNAQANRLARRLRALGVGAETVVGLYLERSVEMVAALLAILKAGGAYLPLDTTYPPERIAYMLEDSGARFLLTEQRRRATLHASATHVLCLDGDRQAIDAQSDENLAPVGGARNLAYVIYTSGSTGRPKGVMIEHRGLCNLAEAQVRAFYIERDSRVLQFAPFSFDASVSEIFTTLITGATLVLAPQPALLPGASLIELLDGEGVTTVTLPPTALAAMPDASLERLRTLVVAGEECPVEVARRWAAGRRFLNAYGPTETTVCATIAECTDLSRGKLPAGLPIANTEVYLLDDDAQPVPFGVTGELHVGGCGLARGYLNRPALTAERFVPNPFSHARGARLYKTGDLARFLPDGQLELLGRRDEQLKVRGFRIEPGEIEAALMAHADVRETVVVAREEATGDKRLVAYTVAAAAGRAPGADELRRHLKERLPEYMIPSAFVALDALPLTPSGKIDRRRLPSPDGARPDAGRGYVAPRTTLEKMLAEMWQSVLRVSEVGIEDNFFELGGDSIHAAVLINSLQKRLGAVVYVVALFDAPTIASLAAYLDENYRDAVARACGDETRGDDEEEARLVAARRIDASQIARVRELIDEQTTRQEVETARAKKNPPAVFVLSPPRSGSTLLRVMLGGHPSLFAPPELELLSFATLAERREELSGRYQFWLEGTIRALMQIDDLDAERAAALMRDCESRGLTTQQFYALMQERIGARTLVDKTPSYALEERVLRRAENYFDGARYIHLLRHPLGMIRSFEEAKLEQVFFRYRHPFTRRELAELVWVVSQQNILKFLETVPTTRQHRMSFERLVREPQAVLDELCAFLGVEFHPEMLQPYRDKGTRMTDGIHPLSKMLGDVKFHEHQGIDAGAADSWKTAPQRATPLGDATRELAAVLGYELPEETVRDAHASLASSHRELTPIRPAARRGTRLAPLSFAQQRLWFIDQITLDSPFYNIPEALRLRGQLDVRALERSLDEIVRRHEALRTNFTLNGDEPVQSVGEASAHVALDVLDLTDAPQAEEEALRLAVEEAHRPFNLSSDLLIRARLLRLGVQDHVLLITMHHIASDGWSMGIFFRELAALYESYSEGRAATLAELPVQYADFAVWQREYLTGAVLDEQITYWRERLGGELPVLELLTDRTRPALLTYKGADEQFALSPELTSRLKALARREGATSFMLLLAAFKTLLQRYTGQTDIIVGTPVAGRSRAELEHLIGFFVNTLVLRTDLAGDPTFLQLLARVRQATLGAYAHQDVPFEKLVEELQPERDMSRNPIFQVMFALQNAPMEDLSLRGLQLEALPIANDATRFDIEFHLWESDGALAGNLIYNTDLFDASTVARLLEHFQNLLAAVAAEPETRISALSMLSEDERRQTLFAWNDTARDYPRDRCVHELFAEQAARTPDAVAVTFEGERITYRELDARSNRMARYLRARGVGGEVLVGVMMERSVEMIVALLAILKAGGAYVPLDLAYPARRLQFMLEDAGVRVLLAGREQLRLLPRTTAEVICMDDARPEIDGESPERLHANATPDNLAYVIYTSGSTGTPKGVCINHRAINRLVCNTNYVELRASDCVAQAANSAFDAATFEIWGALLHGARLAIVSRDVSISPQEFAEYIRAQGVSVLFLTTALFNQMARNVPSAFAPLNYLLFGGEAVDPQSVRKVLLEGAPRHLLHVYGPTENTTFSTWHAVTEVATTATTVPIGRPLSNSQAYVLDAAMQPSAVGAAGELYVGGDGLMRGYLRRPELTAEKLVPHPFSTQRGARLYRTGDRVRLTAGGALEFLGRFDDQIKVRGFRIEPGEIEAALEEHAAVRECVVAVREEQAGERRIVAYVVADEDAMRDETPEEVSVGGEDLRAGQVTHWQKIFDEHIYSKPSTQPDPTFNITGWNSSYTDEPLPAQEMRVWLADTLEPVRAARPRSILEIGCGTGLLLAQLAPACERYWGTDVSQVALDYVSQQVSAQGERLSSVSLFRRAAHDFEAIEPQSFDSVILNSVVQYFPDVSYLERVLEGAVDATAPGGLVYVGDVRSLPLLEAFHASVQLFKAEPSVTRAELRERVRARVAQENELAVDPAFFFALKERLPRISRVEVRPKRGAVHNELTRFRYQVLIHVEDESDAPAASDAAEVAWLDWDAEGLTTDALKRLLVEQQPSVVALARVPNARLSSEVKILDLLSDDEGSDAAARVRQFISEHGAQDVDPEDLYALAGELSYEIRLSWARHGADGRFDVLLRQRADGAAQNVRAADSFPAPELRGKALKDYGNNPLRRVLARRLAPQLRAFLQERLPEYMLPSAFVVLDALPLNANGKLDRRALPAPDASRPELKSDFIAPRTAVEERVAGIWRTVLGVERVGIHDNFFDLGGHSLMATQVNSRLCDAFEMDLPLRCLFETPTVAGLSVAIVQKHAAAADDELLAQALAELDELSEEEVQAMLASDGRATAGGER
jgi:amino acid adenylation domain-containing protein